MRYYDLTKEERKIEKEKIEAFVESDIISGDYINTHLY